MIDLTEVLRQPSFYNLSDLAKWHVLGKFPEWQNLSPEAQAYVINKIKTMPPELAQQERDTMANIPAPGIGDESVAGVPPPITAEGAKGLQTFAETHAPMAASLGLAALGPAGMGALPILARAGLGGLGYMGGGAAVRGSQALQNVPPTLPATPSGSPIEAPGTDLGNMPTEGVAQPPQYDTEQLKRLAVDQAPQLVHDFGIGAAMNMVPDLVTKGIIKVAAPIAGKMAETVGKNVVAQEAAKLAEAGTPISPTEYAPSFLGKTVTWLAEKFPLSRGIVDYHRTQVNDALLAMRQDLVQGTLGLADPTKMIPVAKAETKAAFSALSKEAGGPQVQIPVQDLVDAVQAAVKSDASVSDSFWTKNPVIQKLRQMEGSPKSTEAPVPAPTPRSYEEILSSYGDPNNPIAQNMARSQFERQTTEPWYGMLGVDSKTGMPVASSSSPSVPTLPLEDLNSLYASIWRNQKGTNVFGRLNPEQVELRQGIRDLIPQTFEKYDQMMGTATAPAAEKAMASALGVHEIVKARAVEKLLSNSSKLDEATGYMRFYPTKFDQLLTANKDRLYQMLGPEKFNLLEQFRNKTMAAVPDVAKMSTPRSAADIAMLSVSGLGTTAATIANPFLAVPAAFSPMVAYSLMKPSGWLRQWLTKGFKVPEMATSQVLKIGAFQGLSLGSKKR